MAKPKIARRCTVCGASIRKAAFFCPQCGEQLARQDLVVKPTTSVVTTPLDELSVGSEEATNQEAADAQKLEALESQKLEALESQKLEASDPQKLETLEASATPPPETSAEKPSVGKVRGRIQRATTLARGVEGDVKHRVQKVRQMSSVVLDEAGYDPSLRFILVAAALFLLFLVVMLLNKLIV